jgi:peptide/nickel transport system substrate-binding protein
MQQRFGIKDFVLFTILALLMVTLLLAMFMVDRQWQMMSRMQQVMTEQADDLRGIRKQVAELQTQIGDGILTAGSAPANPETSARSETSSDLGPFSRAGNAAKQDDFAAGDWFVRAFGVSLKTISPLVSSDAYAAQVQDYVLESLLHRNPDTLQWEGLLARSWKISDDGLTITFKMQNGVRFSDGKPLTADDVKFTFDFIMNEAIAAPRQRATLNKVASVNTLGPLTVEFQFAEPYFDALSLAGTMAILPRHFYEPYLKEPATFNQSKGLLLGSGPYRLADPKNWTPDGGSVELERNQRYWGPIEPPFNKLLWKIIENDSARLTTFRNGDIDRYDAKAREYKTLVDDGSLDERSQRFEFMNPIAGYSFIGWNQQKNGKPTRFANRDVRMAMTLLADREAIIDEIMLGYAEMAISPFSPRSKQHDPANTPHPHAPEQAKRLLEKAGYLDRNGDGVLEDVDGAPFEFELTYFQDSDDTRRIVLFLKDLYARAGIVLKPQPSEWSVMIDTLNNRTMDAITLGWTSGVETDVYQMFHGTQIDDGGDNFIHFKNDEFDRLVDQARATVEESQRMPIWQQVEHIFHTEQPYTFLMRRKTLAFIDQRLKNLEITKLGLNLNLLPMENYVPSTEQRYQR